jgi:hypothetical protein
VPKALRRLILWDYERGVWQYDVICCAILIFLFASPAAWFNDQPHVPNVSQVNSPAGESAFWIDTELVTSIPEDQRLTEISRIVTARTHKPHVMSRIEPVYDAERELKGYMAFSKP